MTRAWCRCCACCAPRARSCSWPPTRCEPAAASPALCGGGATPGPAAHSCSWPPTRCEPAAALSARAGLCLAVPDQRPHRRAAGQPAGSASGGRLPRSVPNLPAARLRPCAALLATAAGTAGTHVAVPRPCHSTALLSPSTPQLGLHARGDELGDQPAQGRGPQRRLAQAVRRGGWAERRAGWVGRSLAGCEASAGRHLGSTVPAVTCALVGDTSVCSAASHHASRAGALAPAPAGGGGLRQAPLLQRAVQPV